MSDILSQDQIDALLSGIDADGSGSESGAQQGGTPVDKYPALKTNFELFFEQAGSVISTVLNKKTEFSVESCEKADFSAIQSKISAVMLSLTMGLSSGIEGEFYLLIQKKDVAVLSDLMLMGDGNAEYSDDHKDAIVELFNQVMGAYTNSLGSEAGVVVSAVQIEAADFDIDSPPFEADNFDMVIASMNVEDAIQSYVALLVPEALSDNLIEKSGKSETLDSDITDGSVGLNMSEIDDLSKVTSFDSGGSDGFRETSLTGQTVDAPRENIGMLLDIDLDVSIELGRSSLSIKRVLELAPGSIVELDRMAGEPVDLMVNNKVVAKGEVVVIDESFGIRIVSLVSPEDRIKSLK